MDSSIGREFQFLSGCGFLDLGVVFNNDTVVFINGVNLWDSIVSLNLPFFEDAGYSTEELSLSTSHGMALEIGVNGKVYIFHIIKSLSLKTIAHEASHVVDFLISRFGLKSDINGTELRALLTGVIVERAGEVAEPFWSAIDSESDVVDADADADADLPREVRLVRPDRVRVKSVPSRCEKCQNRSLECSCGML